MQHRRMFAVVLFVVITVAGRFALADEAAQQAAEQQKPDQAQEQKDWAMNATIIEACSCPMFCQCYFDSKPAAAGGHAAHADHANHNGASAAATHYCKFNNGYKVNSGHYGDTKLDDAHFWVSGDLGDDFSDGEMNWAVLTFDPAVTPQQREGIKAILGHVYPVKWKSFTVADDKPIEWKASKDRAEARLDGGKAAEVVLKRNQGMTDDPIVIKNLKYWGVPRHDGFVLMQNEVEAMRQAPEGQEPFEYKGTNGFMITFDIKSSDVANQPAGGGQ